MSDHLITGPWKRGETNYEGGTITSSDVPSTPVYPEGEQVVFPDKTWTSTPVANRTGNPVVCQVVRNATASTGFNLLPKRLVKFASGFYGTRVDGYSRLTPVALEDKPYPVDEFLPTAGVPQYDLFYIVVRGPALVLTSLGGDATNVIDVNGYLVALTAATSGATTAGRIGPGDFTGATAVLAAQIFGAIGKALSAKTTGNTNADLLIHVGNL